MSQSSIQSRYVAEQTECQTFAERNIDRYTQGRQLSPADHNSELVVLFSDCMGKAGWQVGKPQKSGEVASTSPFPSPNYPAGYPAATVARQPVPAGAAAPAPTSETTPMQQPYGYPQPTSPAPATYQPTYGTGPGRNF